MALLEGKKRWILYPKEDAPLLYPVWPEGCHDPVFEADLDKPDAVRTPAALLAKGASCILEAGGCVSNFPEVLLMLMFEFEILRFRFFPMSSPAPSSTLDMHTIPELRSTKHAVNLPANLVV